MKKILCILLCVVACQGLMAQKWEKIGDRPQMGWNTWNKFAGNINEELVRGIADALVETGMRDAGYTYINSTSGRNGEVVRQTPSDSPAVSRRWRTTFMHGG